MNSFFGLGKTITLNGLTAFIQKLIVDAEIQQYCHWLFDNAAPERFAELLYNIGFAGLQENGAVSFRSLGSSGSKPPAITSSTRLAIHSTYATALNLQDVVIDGLEDDVELRQSGIVAEVPGAITSEEYYQRLVELQKTLELIEPGKPGDQCSFCIPKRH